MPESKLKDIIKVLKNSLGLKLIVRDYNEQLIRIIVFNRNNIDGNKAYLLSNGGEVLKYDDEGKIKVFSLNGMKIDILSHEECG